MTAKKSGSGKNGTKRLLPERTQRSARTSNLNAFNDAVTTVNNFFWIARAGFHALTALRPVQARSANDFLPKEIAEHLNTPLPQLDAQVPGQLQLLRYLCLVYAVTEYEEYLRTLIRDELLRRPLPTDKTPKLTLSLAAATTEETAKDFIHRTWAEARAKEVVNEGYASRPSAVDRALEIDVVSNGSEHDLNLNLLNASCIIRNCVVHAAGRVDRRTLEAVGPLLPELILGSPINFNDAFLFRLIEAMWHHAQDIDVLVRER